MRSTPLRTTLVLAVALAAGPVPRDALAEPADGPRALGPGDGIVVLRSAEAGPDAEADAAAAAPPEAIPLTALRAALAPEAGVAADVAPGRVDQGGTTLCTWTALAAGTPASGELTAGDCRWGQLVGPDDTFQVDPSRVDLFSIVLDERSELAVTLTPGFDAQIGLRDGGFGRLRDVTAPSGAPAVLRATLPAGRYAVTVRPALRGGAHGGSYQIAADVTAAPAGAPCTPGTLAQEGAVDGELEARCALFDWLPDQAFDNAAALYELVLAEPGDLSVAVTAAGGGFVPLLAIMTADRSRDLAVDASGGAGDPSPDASAISLALPAGRYWVLVAAAQPGGTGAFTLASQFDSAAGRCAILPADGTPLALGEAVTATLAEDGCRTGYLNEGMLHDAPARVYRVFIPQQGVVTFGLEATGFEPLVQLLNTRLEVIPGVGTLALGNGSQLQISTPRDFLVVVQGDEGAVGDVELTVQLQPFGDDCAVQAIPPTGQASGRLDGADCNLEDWVGIADSSKADLYTVHLPSRGRLRIELASSDLQPYLWLLGRDRIFNIPADDAGTGTAAIEQVFEPGNYLIGANSFQPAIGDYTLRTTFTPMAAPTTCPLSPVALPAILDAELSGTECRVFDTDPTSGWPSPVDRYRLVLPTYGELSISASSEEFVLRMALFEAGTKTNVAILVADDLPAETATTLRLPPGEYDLEIDDAFLYYPESGAYHLEVSHLPLPDPRPCTEVDLAGLPGTLVDPGYALDGELTETDCVVGDFPQTTFSQFPVDTYLVSVPQRGTLTIDLRSDDFDPRLDVLDWAYGLVLQNDDADDVFDTNSHIESAIGPGLYRIQALAVDQGYGPYELDIIFRPEPYLPPADATPTPTSTGGPTTATPTPTATGSTPGPTPVGRAYLPWTGNASRLIEP